MSWAGNMLRGFFAVAAASLAAAGWSTGEAHALQHNQCATPQKIYALLQEEGHDVIAAMDRLVVTNDGETDYRAEFVTANQGGRAWYMIRADIRLGGLPVQMCVTLIGRDLEINDYRREGLPTVTQYEFDENEALQQCEEQKKRTEERRACGFRDSMLKIAESDLGERMALQGLVEDRQGVARGLITIVADPADDFSYKVLSTADAGATTISEGGVRFAFAPPVLGHLDQSRQ